ncbi:hypothetical protein NDR87_33015 [Nocardia sp. CDC159]|uniref:Uncharacterized protein n=1 Tax=Nocardia pulmonis TaxID=2951408 RepID=A0A9X2EDM0_9NOCA|nr:MULTISPECIES: hypothetical protein [Nocardia]MCM6778400.1 hypothetical protein [Nocardia pulmonis]MCM6791204.1 hypothetical protein [Nocardia sp. CDC159]
MTYYLAHRGGECAFFGVPFPAVGVRVEFDRDKLFAARERLSGAPAGPKADEDDGLVVHEEPMAVLALPDRLWRVDDLDGEIRIHPSNRWIRCTSLTVREELPNWLVMGPHGDLVAQVIDQARDLTDEQARAIAAMDPDEEIRLTRTVWDRWLHNPESPVGCGSPVGAGLLEVHQAVTAAARRTGPHLFGWDQEDEAEVITDMAWRQADAAATAAALAYGAPHILDDQENRRLALRWTAVIGTATSA